MTYKVLDIYKDLARTNCGDCGRGSCFAFASAVYLEGVSPALCPFLAPEQLAAMQQKLDQGREQGEGTRAPSNEQALRSLLAQMHDSDLALLAERSGGELVGDAAAVDGRAIHLDFLDGSYLASSEGVETIRGEEPPVSVKILLLIYLTRASGCPLAGSWVAYRDLPNTVSKSKSCEQAAERIARRFSADRAGLAEASRRVGGEPVEAASADAAFVIRALPYVPVLLLFWDAEEEFPARVSLLLDRDVLDYLDQEAIVFMAEALAARLAGEDLADLVA